MCGIVGLFAKSDDVQERLGVHLEAMLIQMNDRGPDSAGVAFYRDPAAAGSCKLTLHHPDEGFAGSGWRPRRAVSSVVTRASSSGRNHAVVYVEASARMRPSCGWLWPTPRCG